MRTTRLDGPRLSSVERTGSAEGETGHAVRRVQAYADEVTEQLGQGLAVGKRERGRQKRGDIRAQMIRVASAEKHDVDARLVTHKAISGFSDRARSTSVQKKTERVGGVREPTQQFPFRRSTGATPR